MVPDVEQGPAQTERNPDRLIHRAANHRHTESQEDDPDIFDAMVRQQALQVVLRDCGASELVIGGGLPWL